MDSRTLLSDLQGIAHKFAGRYRGASKENKTIFTQLNNLSLDTTVTAPAQLVLLLNDLQAVMFEMGRLDKVVTSEKAMPVDQQEANYEIRTALSDSVKDVLHELAKNYQLDPVQAPSANVPRFFINAFKEAINKQHPEMNDDPINRRFKDMDRFNIGSALSQQPSATFSHATRVVQKEIKDDEDFAHKHESNWYAKFCDDKTIAGRELVIQEFFRLLLPHQPKTRIAKNDDNEMFILSKEVANAIPLSAMKKEALRLGLENNSIHGLGNILVAALCFNDVDMRLPNLMVDANGQISKIDGDWALAAMRDDRFVSEISAEDINTLPRIEHHTAYNWLDLVEQETINSAYLTNPDKTILSPALQTNPGIRGEINETMMHLLVLPKDFVNTFISKYLADPIEIKEINDELIFTLAQLRKAALKNPSFRDYLASPEAQVSLNKFIANITNFKVMSDDYVLENSAHPPALHTEFSKLKNLAEIYAKNFPAPSAVAPVSAPAPDPVVVAVSVPPPAPTAQQILQNMQIANARANATAAAQADVQAGTKLDIPLPPAGSKDKVQRKSVLDTMSDQVRAFFKRKVSLKSGTVAPLPIDDIAQKLKK